MFFKVYITLFIVNFMHIRYCETVCHVRNSVAVCVDKIIFPLYVGESIKKLIVKSKKFTFVSKYVLIHYMDLEEIEFGGCNIKYIDPEAFVNNKKLTLLNLTDNKNLKLPPRGSIFKSTSIETLIMQNTGLTLLPIDIFSEMPNLSRLVLADNLDLFQETNMESLYKALQKSFKLNTLIFMKDNNVNTDELCNLTKIKQIYLKSYGDENEEVYEELKCHLTVLNNQQSITYNEYKNNLNIGKHTTTTLFVMSNLITVLILIFLILLFVIRRILVKNTYRIIIYFSNFVDIIKLFFRKVFCCKY